MFLSNEKERCVLSNEREACLFSVVCVFVHKRKRCVCVCMQKRNMCQAAWQAFVGGSMSIFQLYNQLWSETVARCSLATTLPWRWAGYLLFFEEEKQRSPDLKVQSPTKDTPYLSFQTTSHVEIPLDLVQMRNFSISSV